MTDSATKENMQFQTEVNQLLHLMIHSLYSNKEIFLRELISNGSDACDKLRFEAIGNDSLYENDGDLRVEVEFDSTAGTITVRDNGIGMSRDEVVNNIGTIAKSGTKEFLSKLTGDQQKDSHLIGQFGVGFYSSFIVADKVTLTTRRAGTAASEAVRWESDAQSGYSLEQVEKATRGTEIVLHLKEDEKLLADGWRLRNIIRQYSDHIPLPVMMHKQEEGKQAEEWETVNKANALWTRSKSDVKDEEYQEFYKHVSHDWEDALAWSHNRVEGKYEYTSLLYLPSKAPFDLFDRDTNHGLKLYVQRVFIMEDKENKLLPRYLRFVRGVLDSADLPLNVSREILQGNKIIESMKSGSVKKILGLLENMSANEPEKYQSFWKEFGKVLKEGPGEDFGNREEIAKLLRFSSTLDDNAEQKVSLPDYIARMKEGQDKIFYITADTHTAAKNSPHLEVFRKKGIEVLLLSDRVDEWLVQHLMEFDGKSLQSVAKGDLDLSKLETEEDKKEQEKVEAEAKNMVEHIKKALTDKVEDVKVSHRLTSSPSCIILGEHDMALYMQNLLKQAGHEMPTTKPLLEINPTHPLLKRMEAETDDDRFAEWASVLLDQAILAEGGQLEDPAGFVHRLNGLMLAMA
ncbi:molecular chaperone HtpG [Thiothrix nivea]|uniref:Chaperone protein HtpG n=1 Tax=Thiothrix nivea (strain ATCC 35100 / DSM 5205 / JP2) TaxID=870187 RepID=A0A656HIY5_THINJ|nr:molecular chaperone HtpG [Thiothrix nivea]EIJ36417.1 Chaperone protein htpG [Thiothrix nivea DSM 5205]